MPRKNKGKAPSAKTSVSAMKKDNQLFFMAVAAIFLLSLMTAAFMTLLSDIGKSNLSVSMHPSKQKVNVDSGGCLIDSGYSWCGFKNRCVLKDKESCDKDGGDRELLEKYLSSTTDYFPPTAGEKNSIFTVSEVNLLSDNIAFIGYDDGRNFYNAKIVFSVLPNKMISIEDFAVKNKNGEPYELSGCKQDADCVPLPSECHPHSCVNKNLASDFSKPEACDDLFDSSAAYKSEDCACDFSTSQCFNKNSIKLE
jgi:hypothetical protein